MTSQSKLSLAATTNGSSRNRSWAQLPVELLHAISSKLPNIPDYIMFRSVCAAWRSAATPARLPPQFPCLLLPHDSKFDARAFFDVSSGEHRVVCWPETWGKQVCGSGFGWLALIDADSAISLWNPFNRGTIDLPRPFSLPSYLGFRFGLFEKCRVLIEDGDDHDGDFCLVRHHVHKGYPWIVSLSSSPGDVDCVVTAVLTKSEEFAYCRLGDETWTIVKTTLTSPIASVVFREGRFYAFDKKMIGFVLDPQSGESTLIPPPAENFLISRLHVVAADDGLLMILYYHRLDDYEEDEEVKEIQGRIGVFRLDHDGEWLVWVEVESIGDSTIFLSCKHSFAVCARDLPGCRENCIYFSSPCDSTRAGLQPGVPYVDMFDMDTKQFQAIKCPWVLITKTLINATWFTPSIEYPIGMVKEGVFFSEGKAISK